MSLAPLIVLSGPSGVGKTTVVAELLATTRLPIRRAVTATTRTPRPGERPGQDYHFWTVERFREAIAANELLEHAVVHGTDHYGTPRAEVDPIRATGTAVLLVIDVQGAAQVRATTTDEHQSVFLMPPSWEALRDRLTGRSTEAPAKIAARLRSAEAELERRTEFHVRVVNDNLADTVTALAALIREQFSLRGLPCTTT